MNIGSTYVLGYYNEEDVDYPYYNEEDINTNTTNHNNDNNNTRHDIPDSCYSDDIYIGLNLNPWYRAGTILLVMEVSSGVLHFVLPCNRSAQTMVEGKEVRSVTICFLDSFLQPHHSQFNFMTNRRRRRRRR